MTLRTALSATIAVTALVQAAHAQPDPTTKPAPIVHPFEKELDALFVSGGLTADEAARRAIKVSPIVRRSAAEIEIAIATAQAAELARVPIVGATLGYNRLSSIDVPVFDPGMTGMGFSFPVLLNSFTAQAHVSVTLSDYIIRYPKIIAAAKLGMEVARVSRLSTEVNAGQEARLAYYEWIRSKLQVLIAQHQLKQVRSTLAQVRALAEAQRLSRADLMRVESGEANAEQTLTTLTHFAILREEQLRLLIDAPPGTPLAMGEDIRLDVTAPQEVPVDKLITTAEAQRMDFKVLTTGIAAKEKQREAEHSQYYPKLNAFGQIDYANPNQRIFPVEEEFNMTWVVGLSLSWNLNDALFANTVDRRLRGETDVLRADLESLERGTHTQIIASQQAVAAAQAALTTSMKGLLAAEEGYRVRQELLNAQRATSIELVDAETDLTRSRVQALNARIDLRVAIVQLEHALGNDAK